MILILSAETYGNCMATSCPSGANKYEAENMLKTKDRKRQFSKNEAENMLKTKQLPKTVKTQNCSDKLSCHAECCARGKRLFSAPPLTPILITQAERFQYSTPSPVPPRLMKAPVAGHPLPQRGEGSKSQSARRHGGHLNLIIILCCIIIY